MRLLFILMLLSTNYGSAIILGDAGNVVNEALLINCQAQGHKVFYSCIQIPPTTTEKATYCAGIYSSYLGCSQKLNAPLPMVVSLTGSPFLWSPYDICRFEVASLVLFDLCPSIP